MSLCVVKLLSFIGAVVVAYFATRVIALLFDVYIRPGKNLNSLKVGNASWACVTGATDGIGKAMAMEFAGKGFNILLISRNPKKLEDVSKEVESLGVSTKVYAVDYTKATKHDFQEIQKLVDSINVCVLVNNVGLSHESPIAFEDETEKRCEDMIQININTLLKMTRIVIPRMKLRRRGLIINSGSFSALVPTPYLSVYTGTKAFVSEFSQALGVELEPYDILVEHLDTYFVCTSMSKIRRPNFFTPTPSDYAKAVVKKIGVPCGASLPYTSTPYPGHAFAGFVVEWFMTRRFWLDYNCKMQKDIRAKALRKQERLKEQESAKQK